MRELMQAYGVSGMESAVTQILSQRIQPHCDRVATDKIGNLIAQKNGLQSKQSILLTAPMDEAGVIVNQITEEGYLKFETIGNFKKEYLSYKQVSVHGVDGVIGHKAVHLSSKEERSGWISQRELYIDIGAKAKEDAMQSITVGDVGLVKSEAVAFGDGYIKGRAAGSRAACAVLAELLQEEMPTDLEAVFAAQKEIGARGLSCAIKQSQAKTALILDGAEGIPKDGLMLGCGGDLSLSHILLQIAKEQGILLKKTSAYDKKSEQVCSRAALRGITLLIPVRNMGSASQIVAQQDAEEAKRLIRRFTEVLPQ